MERIKYLLKKIKVCNYKDMIKKANEIHKKRGKLAILIFLDMIYCGIKYGAGYSDYVEFEFDLLSENERKTYLTSELNNRIVKKYNNKAYWHLFQNKGEFNNIFKKYIGRDYLEIEKTSFKDFKDFCLNHKKICVKPLSSSCGEGIRFISIDSIHDFKKLYEYLKKEKLLVEEYIKQHDDLNKLYSGSVNTLRIISFLSDNNKVNIIKVIMKFGTTGEIDNHVAGGMYSFLDDNGVVLFPACDDFGNSYIYHPVTNTKIVGFKVPYFKEAKELIKKAGKLVPEIRYVGWDVAITDKGPIIVEGNEYCGLFQNKASTNPTKNGDLPIFKKYIDF